MGDFGEQIKQELEDMFADVESWVDGAEGDIGGFADSCVENITKLDDHFVALGVFAGELFAQAENELDDKVAQDLYKLGNAVVKEAVRVGKEVEDEFKQMKESASNAISDMEDAISTAGRVLNELGEDFMNSPAGQKTKIFIMGAVEYVSQGAQRVAGGTAKLYDRLKPKDLDSYLTDGISVNSLTSNDLHIVLADGIKWAGDHTTHFVGETIVNEVGGAVARKTILAETALRAIGLEEEGKAIRDLAQKEVENLSKHVKKAMKRRTETFETLFRDPDEFVELIEQEPWRVLPLVSVLGIGLEWKFTWSEEKLREFAEYEEIKIKLPKGWLSDL